MCVHPKVNPSKSKTSSSSKRNSHGNTSNNQANTNSNDINHACTKLNKERKCRYRNNLEGFSLSNEESSSQSQQAVLDIEELVSLGQSRTICPFYYTKSQIANADIIFIPYNYLFDREARKNSLNEVKFENSVIIFDEAHNLESFASESASFDLTSIDIAGCIIEVGRCIGYCQSNGDFVENSNDSSSGGGSKAFMENLLTLKAGFLQLEKYLDDVIPSAGGSFSGEYIFEIFAKGFGCTHKKYGGILSLITSISQFIMEIQGNNGSGNSGTPKLDHFVSCIRKVFDTTTEIQCMAKARSYRVHITPKTHASTNQRGKVGGGGSIGNNQGRTLSYWCFSPALSMHALAALNVRSILITSGTLSPLPSFSLELGLPFVHTLENEHIIAKEQIMVRVIGKGVSGKELTSTYNRRDNVEYITELGNTIISLSKVIPGGVLIFFPSYGVMEACIESWGGPASSKARNQNYANKSNFFQARKGRIDQSSSSSAGIRRYCFPRATAVGNNLTPWQRLLASKAIVLEPKTSAELKDVIDEFDKFIALPKSSGCIMMGVCRGRLLYSFFYSSQILMIILMNLILLLDQGKFLKVLTSPMRSVGRL